MCDIWKNTDRQEISLEKLKGWLDSWYEGGVRQIVLSGGEALMHSRAEQFMAALHQRGFSVILLSTGLLLQKYSQCLVKYCSQVIVSLDGPETVHDAIRRIPRAYAKMKSGIEAIRAEQSDFCIRGRCTVQKANFQSIRATVSAAEDLGLDQISFLAVDTTSEAFDRPGGWDEDQQASVGLKEEDLPLLKAELQQLFQEHSRNFERGFIAESPDKLKLRLLAYFQASLGKGEFPPLRCNAPWVSAVLEANGTLRPCFFHRPYGRLLPEQDLIQSLNSASARSFRGALKVEENPICRRCVCFLALEKEETPK
ncbi:MAG: radical SAM protein [Planctomycetota bacterium]|nr:MAG: radical SAM protein [Planctomycetota bacterium]